MGSQLGALFGGLFGDAGQNFVDLQGGPDKVFGTKPDIAPFVPTDLSAEAGKATAANLANFAGIQEYLNQVIPGFSDMLAQGSQNTLSELRGELPSDVIDQVNRSAAFKSLVGGFSGSGMAKALTARDFGLTSLNLTQMGQNSAQSWASIAEEANSPFTISTSEQAATTANNNALEQATKQFGFNVAAAPDPGALGTFNLDTALGEQMLSIGGGFLGGMGGGGGRSAPSTGAAPGYAYDPRTGSYIPNSAPSTDWRTSATGWSDRRLKTDITYLRTSPQGHRVYRFKYHNGKQWFEGVMADEVLQLAPEAVGQDDQGYLCVDYAQTDVEFKMLERDMFWEDAA